MKIYLASKSPRRKELMMQMGLEFECVPSKKEEDMTKRMTLAKLSESLAEQKADDICSQTDGDRIIIGSDTIVCEKNKRFGKPKDAEDAKFMLGYLSGKWHKVISSLCVIFVRNGVVKKYLTHSVTKVKFVKLTQKMIDDYVAGGEPMDKAGAYAIQGEGAVFVEKIVGSYTSVVGLPTQKLYKILKLEKIIK